MSSFIASYIGSGQVLECPQDTPADGEVIAWNNTLGRLEFVPFAGGSYQPLDADLTAIAGLATTAYGRSILIQADGAAVRSYIGAGTSNFNGVFSSLSGIPTTLSGYGITDAQPLDADLTAIAALATTAYGRSLLIQADGAAVRSYIGAGTSNLETAGSGTEIQYRSGTALAALTGSSVSGSSVTLTGTITGVKLKSTAAITTSPGAMGADGPSLEMGFTGYGIGVNNNGETIAILNGTARVRIGIGVTVSSGDYFAFSSAANVGSSALDLFLYRDAANTLAQRNGANAQNFRIYNIYTDASNNDYLQIGYASNIAFIQSAKNGTGQVRPLQISAGTSILNLDADSTIQFRTAAGAIRWNVNSSGHFLAGADNTYDIGASGATRPRNLFVAGNGTFGGDVTCVGNGYFKSGYVGLGGSGSVSNAQLRGWTTGVIVLTDNAQTDFNRLQFGGLTSAFPSIKRSGTALQARLADDTGFGSFQGKLTTDTAYTAGTVTPTGYLTLYDSTGTAYRVPCLV